MPSPTRRIGRRPVALDFRISPKLWDGRPHSKRHQCAKVEVNLRTLLIHGARSAILAAQCKTENTNIWLANLLTRRHPDIACCYLNLFSVFPGGLAASRHRACS